VASTGTGFLNVLSDSTATFGDSLIFGLDGDTGVGLVSRGTLKVAGQLGLGAATPGMGAPGGNGTLTINDGGVVRDTPSGTEAALAVGAQAGGMGSISVSGYGSALIAGGEAVLGGTDTGTGITAGGTGDISLSQGGFLGTGSMTIEAGSSLAVDGTSAALVAGNLSDGGGITTSGLLAVTGAVSGTGSLTLDGGLANLGSLDSTNVSFGGAPAVLRVQALSGTSNVSGMQTGDIVDLVGQQGVLLKGDTVTTKSGMLFLSAAPSGDTYKLIHSLDGTAVVLTPASGHGMNDMATADMGLSFAGLDDVPDISGDLREHLGVNRSMGSLQFTANDQTGGYIGATAGGSPNAAAVDLLMAHQSFAG
jgi:hypothetical protein